MITHDLILITTLLCQLEKHSVFNFGVLCPLGLNLRFLVVAESIHAACFECVNILIVVSSLHQLVVNVHCLLVITVMEGAVRDAHICFQIVSL